MMKHFLSETGFGHKFIYWRQGLKHRLGDALKGRVRSLLPLRWHENSCPCYACYL